MPFFHYQGEKVHYIDEGQGDVLLLLPGNTSSSAVHKTDIEFFTERFRVICPDYPGYGKSDRLDELPLDFWWKNAEMCKSLLELLDIGKCIAVGTSGGGIIALNLSILAPNLVLCVVADSISGEYPDKDDLNRQVEIRKNVNKEMHMFWEFAHGPDWKQVIELDSELLIDVSNKGESFYKGRLGEIKCPVLITGSLADEAIPNIEFKVANIARKIPNSQLVLYSTGWHPLIWSRPEDFRNNVFRFLIEISSKRG